jgi:Heavy-metal resistance
VIQHQEAIGLSAEQKDYFKTEIRATQLKFTELQGKLQGEMEKLVTLINQPRVDEQQVLAQLEKVLTVEREAKRQQVTLLVRIKNKLTPTSKQSSPTSAPCQQPSRFGKWRATGICVPTAGFRQGTALAVPSRGRNQ